MSPEQISALLARLIAARYWTFGGTRFVPDAPTFLFRFFWGDEFVDFSCQTDEIEGDASREKLRDLFLDFATDAQLNPVPKTGD